MKTARRVVKEEVFPLKNHRKFLAAVASIAAIASLTACGGVKDANTARGSAITIGTTDKITSVDPAGSYDNGSYAVQIQIFPFLYAQDYNTSELSPDIAADDGTWNDDGTEFTVKIKEGLKFANGHDLTASDVKFSYRPHQDDQRRERPELAARQRRIRRGSRTTPPSCSRTPCRSM